MFKSRITVISLLGLVAASLIVHGAKTVDGAYQANFASARGGMRADRSNAASVSLRDGRVLIIGGESSRGVLAMVETYEAGVGFTAAASMRNPRTEEGAAVLSDGRVLVIGGRANNGAVLSDTEIYDPEHDTWSAGPNMLSGHAGATVSSLKDGRVVIAGGDSGSGPSDQIEIYDFASNSFAASPSRLSSPRAKHAAAVLDNGDIVIAGGTDGANTLNTVDLFSAKTGKVSSLGHLSSARSGLTATAMLNGRVLFAGGNDGRNDLATADVYNPASGEITQEAALMSVARSGHTATRLKDNNTVLIIGGVSNGQALSRTEAFVPWRHAFIEGAKLFSARTGASVAALPGGRLLAAGGKSANLVYGSAETNCVPTITTDKDDYAPGTPVIFTGDCWIPGGTVTISMLEDPNTDQPAKISVTVKPDGTFTDSSFAPDLYDLGVRFYVTATEPNPSNPSSPLAAQTSFTDASNFRFKDGTGGTCASGPTQYQTQAAAAPFGQAICADVSGLGNTVNSAVVVWLAPGVTVGFQQTVSLSNGSFSDIRTPNAAGQWTVAVYPTLADANANTNIMGAGTFWVGPFSGKLAFTTSSFLVGMNLCSPANKIQLQTSAGAPVTTLSFATVVNLSSTSAGGSFYSAAGCTGSITSVTIPAGSSDTPNFWYKDSNTGSPTLTGAASGIATSATQQETIGQLATTTSISASGITYGANGSVTVTVSATQTPAGNVSLSVDGGTAVSKALSSGAATFTSSDIAALSVPNAGNHSLSASYALQGGFAASSATGTLAVAQATPTVTVTPYTVTYDGQSHTATASTITGVNGQTGATVGTVNLSGTTHTAAGTYSDSWSFTGTANYTNIASTPITNTIGKANATVVVANYTVTYDGQPHTPTVTSISGVNGETGATVGSVTLPDSHTNAGTYTESWSFTGTANYNNIAATSITDTINKATATVVVTPYTVTYDGQPHTATVTSITGVGGETGSTVGAVSVTATTHTNAGTYSSDKWIFTPTANYNTLPDGTITDTINKADASVVVTPYTLTYDAQSHSATVTSITGVGGETGATVGAVDVTGTAHTNAGTYSDSWTFTPTANYNTLPGGTLTDTINKADAVVVVTPYSVTYDGAPHTATVTSITGVGGQTGATVGTADVSGTTHTNAGTYSDSWSFTGTANYKNIAATSISDVIARANATVVVTPYNVTYDGNAHTAAVTTLSGVGTESGATVGSVDVTGTAHTNAGTYNDTWTFTPTANYNSIPATQITDKIEKATVTVTLQNLTRVYNGSAQSPTATASVPGLTINITGAPQTNAGSYPVTATISDPNYQGSDTGTFVINKAEPTVTATGGTFDYDGTSRPGSCSVTPASLTVTPSYTGGSAPSNAGTYTLTCSVAVSQNYLAGSATATITINKVNPAVSLAVTNTPLTYDAAAHSAVVTSSGPVAGSVANVSTGGAATQTNTGTYAVTADFVPTDQTNYNTLTGLSVGNFVILKATATVVVTPYTVDYDTQAHTATVTSITGVGGETGATVGTVNVTGTTHTNAGTYTDTWSFTPTANYYSLTPGQVTDTINKATLTVNLTDLTKVYTGSAQSPTASTSVPGVTINLTGAPQTNAGTYSVTATVSDPNYQGSATADFVIAKASSSVTVASITPTYDGSAKTTTALVSGPGTGITQSVIWSYSGTCSSAPTTVAEGTNCTARATYAGDANHNGSYGTGTITIGAASSTVTVTCGGPYTYTGLAQTPCTAVATGAGNLSQSLTVNYTNNTGAGNATGSASFAGDANHTASNSSKTFVINKAPLTISATPAVVSLTYGDPAPNIIPAYNGFVNSETAAVLTGAGCSTTYQQFTSTVGNYTSNCTGTSPNYAITYVGGVANVAVDLAGCKTINGVYTCYTGQKYAWTPTATSNTATIQLGATIVDQTPNTPGDIRNAKVTFGLRDNAGGVTPISSATNLAVGLVTPGDNTVGTAGAAVQFSLNSNDICNAYTVAVLVNGSYKKTDAAWQDTQVTLCRAVPGSIESNPALQVSNTGSGGMLADTSSSQSSVTFGVKYTQKGTNAQGKAHVIVKSDHNSAGVVDGKVHTYAIDSNAISTLNVTTGATSTADFQAKCNVVELVTNPDNTITAVSLDGGALMALSLDATNQKVGVTINKSKSLGGMWFSSGWDGKQTVNKPVVNLTDAPIKITGN